MPIFTAISLENLLEPTVRVSLKKPPPTEPNSDPDPDRKPKHLYISPALYATPEQAPIAAYSSPEPVSPSPYVANQKRRSGRREEPAPELAEREELGFQDEVKVDFLNGAEVAESEFGEAVSEVEVRQIDCRSFVSAQGEFFDANDDFSSLDGSICSYGSRNEFELNAVKFSLTEEIERRKNAEEMLYLMQCQWERISKLMSQAGFTFPELPSGTDNSMQLENNLTDQFSQEIAVTRFVAEAIGRGEARAEAEDAFTSIIESKDQEILRLRDRLQYFETVNHELSQRKLVEVARRQQERKRSRRRWVRGSMGLSIAIGASLLAYTYLPQTSKYLSLLKSVDSTDTSDISKSS